MENYRKIIYIILMILFIALSGCIQGDVTDNETQDQDSNDTVMNDTVMNDTVMNDTVMNDTVMNDTTDTTTNVSDNDTTSDSDSSLKDSDRDGVPNVQDDYPRDDTRSRKLLEISENININRDDYWPWPFNLTERATVRYTVDVERGINIDVFIMDRSDYADFQDESIYSYYPDATALDTSNANVKDTLRKGEYLFIIDTTDRKTGSPDTYNNNTVKIKLVAYK